MRPTRAMRRVGVVGEVAGSTGDPTAVAVLVADLRQRLARSDRDGRDGRAALRRVEALLGGLDQHEVDDRHHAEDEEEPRR